MNAIAREKAKLEAYRKAFGGSVESAQRVLVKDMEEKYQRM
jgi:hypothetical protein